MIYETFEQIHETKEYKQGFEAWATYAESKWTKRTNNPFKVATVEFYRWNRGWNSNNKGLEKAA